MRVGLALGATLAVSAAAAAAQDVADIDYEYLSFRGFAVGVGYLWPDRVENTQSFGVRFDMGYAGPGLRVVPSITYWTSPMQAGEIADLGLAHLQTAIQDGEVHMQIAGRRPCHNETFDRRVDIGIEFFEEAEHLGQGAHL